MFDFDRYREALLAFLRMVDNVGQEKKLVAEHLRYPAFEFSTLSGSDFGRSIWESAEARNVVERLLEDNDLHRWFAPDSGPNPQTRLNELRAHIASLVGRWSEVDFTPEKATDSWANSLLDALRNPEPVCSRVRILYGVQVSERIDLGGGLALETASLDGLRNFLRQTGAIARDEFRIPSQPATVVLATASSKREEFGAFAATMANGWADVLADNVRRSLWMATGIIPRMGDSYVFDHSEFPVSPSERLPASVRETHPGDSSSLTSAVNPQVLREIHSRLECLLLGKDPFLPLGAANTFIDPVLTSTDEVIRLLLAYAGCDGLLLRKEDDDTRLGLRLAFLIGADVEEERRLRRTVNIWRDLRGLAAHGQRPSVEQIAGFLEQTIDPSEWGESLLGSDEIKRAAGKRALALLRRVFLGMLFCMVDLSQDGVVPALSREAVLKLLEQAAAGDDSSRQAIKVRVPDFVRFAEF